MKIGIITLYYKSINMGANLQSYALVKTLEKLNYQAEQISYRYTGHKAQNESLSFVAKIRLKLAEGIVSFLKFVCVYVKGQFKNILFKLCKNIKKSHQDAVEEFNNSILHSEKIYDKQNIFECVKDYDVFITGSDQVWNLDWYQPAFFLEFVSRDKIKISYAASVGMSRLDNEQKEIFKNSLKDFHAVSVREANAVEMLKDLSPVTPQYVLDPTLLLSAEEWDLVCAPKIFTERYVFCYFLGEDTKERKVAKKYARKRGLKIVTLPHLNNSFVFSDVKFGDIRLFDVSPEKFLSLIKYAEYVFTDSFHATVFSALYHKEYFVFQRSGRKGMSSRIYSLTKLFESENHFCDVKEKATLAYIEKLPKLDYTHLQKEYEEMRNKSLAFLKENLCGVEEMRNAKES